VKQQSRNISLLNNIVISKHDEIQADLDHSINLVRKYDPSGYLPGLLLSTNDARIGYFAIRAFWVSSGLRFRESPLSNSISSSIQISGVGDKGILIPDDVRIRTWKNGIQSIYDDREGEELPLAWRENATLRLLHYVIHKHELSKCHFEHILLGRERDVNMKQYPTIESLKEHAQLSCGSLLNLVLECSGIRNNDSENDIIFDVAQNIGWTHGIANALRLSIPTAASTGKIIVPKDLCEKYGVKSPRYLLSALSMGDEECKDHLRSAVRDIAMIAREHLKVARVRTTELQSHPKGSLASRVFLPALPSETFLNRLEDHNFDLTDRTLRSVGKLEHMVCAGRLFKASLTKTF